MSEISTNTALFYLPHVRYMQNLPIFSDDVLRATKPAKVGLGFALVPPALESCAPFSPKGVTYAELLH